MSGDPTEYRAGVLQTENEERNAMQAKLEELPELALLFILDIIKMRQIRRSSMPGSGETLQFTG